MQLVGDSLLTVIAGIVIDSLLFLEFVKQRVSGREKKKGLPQTLETASFNVSYLRFVLQMCYRPKMNKGLHYCNPLIFTVNLKGLEPLTF